MPHLFAHACRHEDEAAEWVNDPTISKDGVGAAGQRPGTLVEIWSNGLTATFRPGS